jgi:hypothetical protein
MLSWCTMSGIANRDLVVSRIPKQDADWSTIAEFALTFNGYEHHGSFERCAEIAGARRVNTLTELRTCLFFEQRSWRNAGEEPGEVAMIYIRSLVEKISAKVVGGEFD